MSLPVNTDARHDGLSKKPRAGRLRSKLLFVALPTLATFFLILHSYSTAVTVSPTYVTTSAGAAVAPGEVAIVAPEPLHIAQQTEPPVINVPAGDVPIGKIELSGTAAPNSDLVLVVDGDPVDKIIVDVEGSWAYVLDLAESGLHILTANTLNAAGQVIASSQEVALTLTAPSNVGPILNLADGTELQVGDIELSGSSAPNTSVALLVNGVQVGESPVDERGVWQYEMTIGAPGEYELLLNSVDASGAVIAASEPYTLAVIAAAKAPADSAEGSQAEPAVVETPRYLRQPTNTPYDTATAVAEVTLAPLVTSAQSYFVRPPTDTPRPAISPLQSQSRVALVTGEATRFVRPPTDTPRAFSAPTLRPSPAPLATGQATRFVRLPTQTATNTPRRVAIATTANTPTPQVVPTNTPAPTTATNTATATSVPPTATNMATRTPRPTSTSTATNTPAPTATNTATETSVPPTATNTATRTPRPTSTSTATDTPAPTATNTATETSVPPTATNTATRTPRPTATSTATDTPEPTATNTSTATPLPPTATATVAPVPTATDTAAPTPTRTATNMVAPTATHTPAATSTATDTAVPPTATNTPEPAATHTPTSPAATNTATQLPEAQPTDTPEAEPAVTDTVAAPIAAAEEVAPTDTPAAVAEAGGAATEATVELTATALAEEEPVATSTPNEEPQAAPTEANVQGGEPDALAAAQPDALPVTGFALGGFWERNVAVALIGIVLLALLAAVEHRQTKVQ